MNKKEILEEMANAQAPALEKRFCLPPRIHTREKLQSAVRQGTRLITGPPGSGKTTLAQAWNQGLLGHAAEDVVIRDNPAREEVQALIQANRNTGKAGEIPAIILIGAREHDKWLSPDEPYEAQASAQRLELCWSRHAALYASARFFANLGPRTRERMSGQGRPWKLQEETGYSLHEDGIRIPEPEFAEETAKALEAITRTHMHEQKWHRTHRFLADEAMDAEGAHAPGRIIELIRDAARIELRSEATNGDPFPISRESLQESARQLRKQRVEAILSRNPELGQSLADRADKRFYTHREIAKMLYGDDNLLERLLASGLVQGPPKGNDTLYEMTRDWRIYNRERRRPAHHSLHSDA